MRHVKVIKTLCFCLIFTLIFLGVQFVLQDKWYYESTTYTKVQQFYKENNDIDVVFIGTSHVYEHINPLEIYNEYGFSSFDFATPVQPFELHKFYVTEALANYTPCVIALDVVSINNDAYYEVRYRQALDVIPVSLRKLEAIRYTIEHAVDDPGSFTSWIFPILRYHDRWSQLQANALEYDPNINNYMTIYHGAKHYHGYGPTYLIGEADLSHYYDDVVNIDEDVLAKQKQIIQDINEMCKDNNVNFLLIKTPSPRWRSAYHDIVEKWSEDLDITFVDFNDYIEEIGLDVKTDFVEADNHLNDNGAIKFSHYLGQYLVDNYNLPDHRNDSVYADWNYDYQVYQHDKAAWELSHETDWASYVDKLQKSNYTIYIAVRDNIGGNHPKLTAKLLDLGLMPEVQDATLQGYLAIIDGGKVIYEDLKDEPISYITDVNDHHVEMNSEDYIHGNRASIKLDYEELFVDHRGIGIVVYDNFLEDVVDTVTFDLYAGGQAYR